MTAPHQVCYGPIWYNKLITSFYVKKIIHIHFIIVLNCFKLFY